MKQISNKEYEEFQQYLYNKAHGYIWTPDTLELICGGNDNEPERIGKQMLEMLGRLRNERISHMTSDKHKKYVIRSLRKGEIELLKDFLYEVIFIPKGTEPPTRGIIEKPELRVYTDDFGTGAGSESADTDRRQDSERYVEGHENRLRFLELLPQSVDLGRPGMWVSALSDCRLLGGTIRQAGYCRVSGVQAQRNPVLPLGRRTGNCIR